MRYGAALRNPLFAASSAEDVRSALLRSNGALIDELSGNLADVFHGSEAAAGRYVRNYRLLADALLSEAHRSLPDAVVDAGDGRLAIADASGKPVPALFGVLENAALEAPFTPWTNRYDPAEAVALHVTNHVRSLIGARMLTPPAEPLRPLIDDVAARRFQRWVRWHLSHPRDENPLERLMRLFALSKSELGRLFGVSRQATDGWLRHGIPADRQDTLATLLALGDLLERKLKVERIPGIARRPAEAYGGKTMLELIAAGRHRELLGLVRTSFDWSHAA